MIRSSPAFTDRVRMEVADYNLWREARQFLPTEIADGERRLMRIEGTDIYQWQERRGAWTFENVGPLLRAVL